MGNCQKKEASDDSELHVEIARLRQEIDRLETKSKEEQNLLRYKVEVLLNMVALEEQKNALLSRRVESVKLILLNQGISEDGVKSMMTNRITNNFDNIAVDTSVALDKMKIEFQGAKDEIISSFADLNGKIIDFMTKDHFVRRLYSCTETLSKEEVQLISIRFLEDFKNVSVVEFIEYFIMTPSIRYARAASSSARMCRQLLQVDRISFNVLDSEVGDTKKYYLLFSSFA
jgi:hypothetical protein